MPYVRFDFALGSRTISVPTDFSTIQAAINNAVEGDTVFVFNGVYVENVVVNKPIFLVGENSSVTFIDGGGFDVAVRVMVDNVSISGFTIENGSRSGMGAGILLQKIHYANLSDNVIVSSYAGINLVNSSLNTIQRNYVSDCNTSLCLNFSDSNFLQENSITDAILAGVYMSRSSNNTLEGNMVTDAGIDGVYLKYSPYNKILQNGIAGCDNGLVLEYSSGNMLVSNNISLNKFNFGVSANSLSDYIQDISASNKIDGKSIYYLVNSKDVSLTGPLSQDVGYLALVNSSNIQAEGLTLSGNGEGLLCAYSSNCYIKDSNITSNRRAAFIYYSTGCSIAGNSFRSNMEGVSFVSSTSSSVKNSFIVGSNGYGLRLESSGDSVIEGNVIELAANGALSVYFSPNCNIHKNTFAASGFGIVVQVSTNVHVFDNVAVNNTGDGVYFSYGDGCTAQDNNVTGNDGNGIVFQASEPSTIVGNYVANNTGSGIDLYNCSYAEVRSNALRYNGAGINLQFCLNSRIIGNEAARSAREGISLIGAPNNNVSNNTIVNSGWGGMSLQNSGNSTIDNNIVYGNARFGISLQGSTSVDILNNNVSSNAWDGIVLADSNNSKVLNNSINDNANAGSRLYSTHSVTFKQNSISRNQEGLRIFVASSITVVDNKITQNQAYGIYMYNSTGNRIYHNSMINNTEDVRVLNASGSAWDDGYPSGGNFWSNYAGLDAFWGPNQDQLGSDGIGDTPYTLDSENKDRYPLMAPARFHDLTLERVALPSSQVYVGWVLSVNATLKNSGEYVESVNVTAYYGSLIIETRHIDSIKVGEKLVVSLTWNASGLPEGRTYEVKANVSVVPGETHSEDNVYNFGPVTVKMVGDVNNDRKINILDIFAMATAFNCRIGESRYKVNYDMNLDYVINIIDLYMAAKNFGKTSP